SGRSSWWILDENLLHVIRCRGIMHWYVVCNPTAEYRCTGLCLCFSSLGGTSSWYRWYRACCRSRGDDVYCLWRIDRCCNRGSSGCYSAAQGDGGKAWATQADPD